MEEENLKKYLYEMNRAIRSGNPRFMSYVSREYMKYQNTSPVIAEAIKDMIVKEKNRNSQSPYAVFLDSDGSINLESMSDISRISNLSEFIAQVQRLSEFNIDFENMTADDLIINSERIAEELEKEAASDLDKSDMTENDIRNAEKNAGNALAKLSLFAAIGGAVGGAFRSAISRIRGKMSGLGKKKQEIVKEETEKREDKMNIDEKGTSIKGTDKDESKNIFYKVVIDENKVIADMKNNSKNNNEKSKNSDTYGDGDPDGDDMSL